MHASLYLFGQWQNPTKIQMLKAGTFLAQVLLSQNLLSDRLAQSVATGMLVPHNQAAQPAATGDAGPFTSHGD